MRIIYDYKIEEYLPELGTEEDEDEDEYVRR